MTLGRPLDSADYKSYLHIFNQVIPELDRIRPFLEYAGSGRSGNETLAGSCPGIQVKHSESGGGSNRQHKYILWEDYGQALRMDWVEMSERETSGPGLSSLSSHSGFLWPVPHTCCTFRDSGLNSLGLHFER